MHTNYAAAGYAKVTSAVLPPRSIEQKAFEQVTGLLTAIERAPAPDVARIADAVHKNTLLWSHLAAYVASEENALPEALRAQILSLAIYVQKTGRGALRDQTGIASLVEINRAIMAGLGAPSSTIEDRSAVH